MDDELCESCVKGAVGVRQCLRIRASVVQPPDDASRYRSDKGL